MNYAPIWHGKDWSHPNLREVNDLSNDDGSEVSFVFRPDVILLPKSA